LKLELYLSFNWIDCHCCSKVKLCIIIGFSILEHYNAFIFHRNYYAVSEIYNKHNKVMWIVWLALKYLVILSRQGKNRSWKKKNFILHRELKGSLLSAKKLCTIFFKRTNFEDTIICSRWFPFVRGKITPDGKTCFSFRSKNRSLFWSRTDFHLRYRKTRNAEKRIFLLSSYVHKTTDSCIQFQTNSFFSRVSIPKILFSSRVLIFW